MHAHFVACLEAEATHIGVWRRQIIVADLRDDMGPGRQSLPHVATTLSTNPTIVRGRPVRQLTPLRCFATLTATAHQYDTDSATALQLRLLCGLCSPAFNGMCLPKLAIDVVRASRVRVALSSLARSVSI